MMSSREDIEMAFIRELSTGGLILGGLRPDDRRERIRVAINQRGLKDRAFEPGVTYGAAFVYCFARAVELRILPRDPHKQFHAALAAPGPGDGGDDDDGGEDDDEGFSKRSNTAA